MFEGSSVPLDAGTETDSETDNNVRHTGESNGRLAPHRDGWQWRAIDMFQARQGRPNQPADDDHRLTTTLVLLLITN